MKKILLSFTAILFNLLAFGQVNINFESGTNPADYGYGLTAVTVVANPFSAGINTSANVLQVTDKGDNAFGGLLCINALAAGDKWSNYQTVKFKIALNNAATALTQKYSEILCGGKKNGTNDYSGGSKVYGGNLTALNSVGTWTQITVPVAYLVSAGNDTNPYFQIRYALNTAGMSYYIDDIELIAFPATTNASELTFESGTNSAVKWYNATPTIDVNPYISGINTSANVLKIVDDGLNQYGGAISINTILPAGENWNNFLSIDFKMAIADVAFKQKYMKIIAGVGPNYYDGGTQLFASNASTVATAGTWYQISIPINNLVADAKKTNPFLQLAYGAVNGWVAGTGGTGGTYYIDDIILKKLSTNVNPIDANGSLNIKLINNECEVNISENEVAMCSIYNVTGNLISSKTTNIGKAVFNLEGFSKGVYIVSIKSEKNSYSSKFIKQ